MFLAQLPTSSKEMFLGLCIAAAQANGIVEDQEKALIAQYCQEMNIPMPESFDTAAPDPEQLKSLSGKEKKIILFELFGLLKADSEYDEKEKEFLHRLAAASDISGDTVARFEQLLDEYLALCTKLYQEILSE